MLRCEAEVMDVMDAILMADEELMRELEAQIYEEMDNMKSMHTLHKLCTSNMDATISDIHLTVYTDDTDVEVYQGTTKNYPYEWDIIVSDYSIYNIDNTTHIDAWCIFDKYCNIEIDESNIIVINNNDKTKIFNTPFGEMTKEEFNNWKR